MDASEYQSFADLMRALPREAREKTVARGGFTETSDYHYACKDGLCVMAALLTDLGTPLHYDSGAPIAYPGEYTIAAGLGPSLGLDLSQASSRLTGTEHIVELIRDTIAANDSGDLADPAAVRALLIPEDEA